MVKIDFTTDSAAFGEGADYAAGDEVLAVLDKVAESIRVGFKSGLCRDTNGNAIGAWAWVK